MREPATNLESEKAARVRDDGRLRMELDVLQKRPTRSVVQGACDQAGNTAPSARTSPQ